MNTRASSRKIVFTLLQILALVLFAVGLLFGPVQKVHSAGPYVVNTTNDGPDQDLTDGSCYSSVALGCSLRAAIQQATYDGVATTIAFFSGLAGQTLYLANAYGQIVWDGDHIALYGGYGNNISISGQNLDAGQSVFQIRGDWNDIRFLTIRDAPQDGIQVGDLANVGSGNNNMIYNVNLIANGASGVFVYGGSAGGGLGNNIASGLIGTSSWSSSTCNSGEANYDGIYIASGTLTTTIIHNRIVCNNANGIYLYGASNILLTANQIGNNIINAMPNAGNGVLIEGSNAQHNLIGGNDISDRNVISGNGQSGVLLSGAPYNQIRANMIGLNLDGLSAIPNQSAGVAIVNHADHTTIGYMLIDPLFISGNLREGIYVADSSHAIVGASTKIGVKNNTASSPLGNGLEGIKLDSGVENANINPAIVAYNGGAGIATITKSVISPSKIYENGGLAIDLGNDGPTPNDAGGTGLGPDGWLDYPVITSIAGQVISGISCPGCRVFVDSPVGNPAANGGGCDGSFGYATADGSGIWSYTMPGSGGVRPVTLVAHAPYESGNGTSEMSPRLMIYLPFVRRN